MLQSFRGPALARPGSETVSGVASQSGWGEGDGFGAVFFSEF